MQLKSILIAPGLVSVFFYSALGSAQGLRAQQPDTVTAQRTQAVREKGEASPGATRPDEARQRIEAQVQAQLRLMDVQKRQLEEQGKEQIEQLEELTREQVEQVKGEAHRQIQQLQSQLNRQREQTRRYVIRQTQLLNAQMSLVEAQAGFRSETMDVLKRSVRAGGPTTAPEVRDERTKRAGPSADEKLDRILDRLERLEKRLDSLEKRK